MPLIRSLSTRAPSGGRENRRARTRNGERTPGNDDAEFRGFSRSGTMPPTVTVTVQSTYTAPTTPASAHPNGTPMGRLRRTITRRNKSQPPVARITTPAQDDRSNSSTSNLPLGIRVRKSLRQFFRPDPSDRRPTTALPRRPSFITKPSPQSASRSFLNRSASVRDLFSTNRAHSKAPLPTLPRGLRPLEMHPSTAEFGSPPIDMSPSSPHPGLDVDTPTRAPRNTLIPSVPAGRHNMGAGDSTKIPANSSLARGQRRESVSLLTSIVTGKDSSVSVAQRDGELTGTGSILSTPRHMLVDSDDDADADYKDDYADPIMGSMPPPPPIHRVSQIARAADSLELLTTEPLRRMASLKKPSVKPLETNGSGLRISTKPCSERDGRMPVPKARSAGSTPTIVQVQGLQPCRRNMSSARARLDDLESLKAYPVPHTATSSVTSEGSSTEPETPTTSALGIYHPPPRKDSLPKYSCAPHLNNRTRSSSRAASVKKATPAEFDLPKHHPTSVQEHHIDRLKDEQQYFRDSQSSGFYSCLSSPQRVSVASIVPRRPSTSGSHRQSCHPATPTSASTFGSSANAKILARRSTQFDHRPTGPHDRFQQRVLPGASVVPIKPEAVHEVRLIDIPRRPNQARRPKDEAAGSNPAVTPNLPSAKRVGRPSSVADSSAITGTDQNCRIARVASVTSVVNRAARPGTRTPQQIAKDARERYHKKMAALESAPEVVEVLPGQQNPRVQAQAQIHPRLPQRAKTMTAQRLHIVDLTANSS